MRGMRLARSVGRRYPSAVPELESGCHGTYRFGLRLALPFGHDQGQYEARPGDSQEKTCDPLHFFTRGEYRGTGWGYQGTGWGYTHARLVPAGEPEGAWLK